MSDLYSMRFPSVPYIRKYLNVYRNYDWQKVLLVLATDYNVSYPYKKSVEDVSEETRYILEEFIIERAVEDGVDMGLVRPIIDVNLAARKIIVCVSGQRNHLFV